MALVHRSASHPPTVPDLVAAFPPLQLSVIVPIERLDRSTRAALVAAARLRPHHLLPVHAGHPWCRATRRLVARWDAADLGVELVVVEPDRAGPVTALHAVINVELADPDHPVVVVLPHTGRLSGGTVAFELATSLAAAAVPTIVVTR